MIITLKNNFKEEELKSLKEYFESISIKMKEVNQNTYLLEGSVHKLDEQSVKRLPAISKVVRITAPYKLASRENHKDKTVIRIGDVIIGGDEPVIIAGACSVESLEQIDSIAKGCKESGAHLLRGGAFKPRTSPYFFQGLGLDGLKLLKDAGLKYQMPVVSEITSEDYIDDFVKYVDIIQVGARNMQNFELLKKLGKLNKPILLKRSPFATISEFLLSAEYILLEGNPNVILCERGIRSFDNVTRYALDFASIVALKNLTHLPVIVDPSHAAGDYHFVEGMFLGAIASGADGVMIEVHNKPEVAYSDSYQALKIDKLSSLIDKANKISKIITE